MAAACGHCGCARPDRAHPWRILADHPRPRRAMNLRQSFASAILSLALFGLGRFVFNLVAVRAFGPAFVGEINVSLSSWTIIAVLLGTIPAFVTSRYAPEYMARDD